MRWILYFFAFWFCSCSLWAEDKGDFTLVNKHELAERKKTWQKAVQESAHLRSEHEKIVTQMENQTLEMETLKAEQSELEQQIKAFKEFMNMVAYEQPRIWTSKKGKSLRGTLILDDGTSVTLQTGKEKQVTIPRTKLSDRDLKFLDTLSALENGGETESDSE